MRCVLCRRAIRALAAIRPPARALRSRIGLLVAALLVTGLIVPDNALAQPAMQWSEPVTNEQLSDPPEEIRVGFDQPLDAASSSVRLLDREGNAVVEQETTLGNDEDTLVLPIPENVPDDLYTVQWDATSAEDGSHRSGFYAFATGDDQGMLVSSPPESPLAETTGWLTSSARSIAMLGVTAAAGLLLTWLIALRPALLAAGADPRAIGRWVRRTAYVAVIVGAVGAVVGVVAEVHYSPGTGSLSEIQHVLTGTDAGLSWLLQAIHLVLLSAALMIPALWDSRSGWRMPALAMLAGGSALIPLAVSSHAGSQMVGAAPAIANQWLHLAGVSIWTGGLLLIGVASVMDRGIWRGTTGRRFGQRLAFIASMSILFLTLTGLYAFQLNTGSLNALRETGYGAILLPKLALSALAVLLGAGLLAFWWRQSAESIPRRYVAVAVALIAVVSAGAIMQSGGLVTHDLTARETYLAEQERQAREFVAGDLRGALYLTPGVVGHNRLTLDLYAPGDTLSETAQTVVRAAPTQGVAGEREMLLHPEDICTADGEVIESPVSRYEVEGFDLSLAGDWELDVVIQRLGEGREHISLSISLPSALPPEAEMALPLRFSGFQATLAFLTGAGAFTIGALTLMRRRRGESGTEFYSLLTIVMVVFTVLAFWNGRITHTLEAQARNPIPRTVESIETGREAYLEYCAVCHGDDGQGDGELGPQLERPPADLTEAHMDTHPAGDVAFWIQNGIEPAMPGFGSQLTDDEVWHLVNYLRSLRNPIDEG